MATKPAVNTKKILTDIDKTLQELRTDVNPDNLSSSDKKSILAQLDNLEAAALEAKKAISKS
ncbi:MAG: hypothetical protein ACI85O_001872 [Saprospiraceae bacterium]|jgi:hypothetical protein